MKNTVLISLFTAAVTLTPCLMAQSALNPTPSRAVGHLSLDFKTSNPNIVEGREMYRPLSLAIDKSSSPSALYVADTFNNRVLGWKNAASFTNGATADIVIGQLDKLSTTNLGPNTSRTRGITLPIALAVDAKGNLYVVDGGNNRILRYPKPFNSTEDFRQPDMVIGQQSFETNTANAGGVSARTIATSSNGSISTSGLTFDGSGNLYFSDPFNNRVLRYKASDLDAGTIGPAADLVLGQSTFDSNSLPGDVSVLSKNALRSPSGLTFDNAGRLFVADAYSRVVVFLPTLFTGETAARIMGIGAIGAPTTPKYSEYTLTGPEGVFMIGNNPAVVDTGANRILVYDPYEQWPAETPTPAPQGTVVLLSPAAKQVIGQLNFATGDPNRNLGEPNETTLYGPSYAVMLGTEMFVVDSQNHRMLVFPTQTTGAGAYRVLGQDGFSFNAPNLIEGKELFLYNGLGSNSNLGGDSSDGAGVAVDLSNKANPPRLYIADTFNNRILGYKDARRVRPGDKADIVIGQVDFQRSKPNSPGGVTALPTDTGLFHPSGLAVDPSGNLWVADSGNGRVLRFPSPFTQTGQIRANLVLGQTSFFSKTPDASRNTMNFPVGVALTVDGHVAISDAIHNRVLFFRKPTSGDFTNGQGADRVIGQFDFVTTSHTSATNRFNGPRGISTDTDDRLYVTDTGNNRIVIYDRISAPSLPNDPIPATTITGLNSPQGVFVSPYTGEIWVANTRSGTAVRYPRFDRLPVSSAVEYTINPGFVVLALTQDDNGNLYTAEGSNRVAIYYNGLAIVNTASYSDRPLSPGMIASIYPRSATYLFGDQTAAASSVPLPTTLGDIQVLVNDKPTALYYTSPGQINFLVPMSTPSSGSAEFQVTKPSTGAILAAGTIAMAPIAPALFVAGSNESGQLAAINADDNTVNSGANRVEHGHYITLFGTGQGFIANAPPDGSAPTGPVPTPFTPDVLIGTEFVKADAIQYSGLAPGLIGVWQINVKVPDLIVPSATVPVAVRVQSVLSNRGKGDKTLTTTIAVK
jgi:uncharacterized protein (TIGR03437 family)